MNSNKREIRLAGNNIKTRLSSFSIPIFVLLMILIIVPIYSGWELFLSTGYIIFFLVYIFILIVNFIANFRDWDIYRVNNQLCLRRMFSKDVYLVDIQSVTVEPVLFLSFALKIFKLKTKEKSYFFKIQNQSLYERFFSQNSIAENFELYVKEISDS